MPAALDRSMVGLVLDRTVFEAVTADDIIAYAKAYGETDPLYTDEAAARRGPHGGLVAPPTFPVCLRGRRFMPSQLPREWGRSGFDAGKDIELGVLVRPGDVLTASSAVHDIYEKTGRSGRMVFLVTRTTVTNQDGKTVATIDQRTMIR